METSGAKSLEHDESKEPDEAGLECPVCLLSAVYPVELPCGHIFCFLCVKGFAKGRSGGQCALCRASFPNDVLMNPRLKDNRPLFEQPKCSNYQWFYEARGGGWWLYDQRSMQEIERSFSGGKSTHEMQIAGHMYVIDFANMVQFRQNNRNMFRRIKRDHIEKDLKGIAGIRLPNSSRPRGDHRPGNSTSANAGISGSSSRASTGNALVTSRVADTVTVEEQNDPEEANDEDETDDDDLETTLELSEDDEFGEDDITSLVSVADASASSGVNTRVTRSRSSHLNPSGRDQHCNQTVLDTSASASVASANPQAKGSVRVNPSRASDTAITVSSNSETSNPRVKCLLIGSSMQLTFNEPAEDGEEIIL